MFTTLLTLVTFFISSTLPVYDEDVYQKLVQFAKSIPKKQNLKQGQWSIYVINTEDDRVLLDINGEKSLAPASNLKLLTSAVALSLLDENKTFETYLEHSGTIEKDGTLTGNIYIRGKGDPTLGSSEIEGALPTSILLTQWLEAIQAHGIKTIKGDIIADDSYLDYMPLPGDWFWEDMGNYYAAGTSGLCINENMYRLYFKPGKDVGQRATVIRTDPIVPGLEFINHMKTGPVGSGDNGYIYGAPWQYLHQLEGTIPAGVKEFSIKGSLPDPAKFAAVSLYEELLDEGIKITGQTKTIRELKYSDKTRKQIHVIKSPPLKDIIYRLNKRSVNIYCEQLLKIIARETKGIGSREVGIRIFENWLEERGIYTEGLFLHDASGLSRANATPTRFFAEMLNAVKSENFYPTYYNSLSVAGDPDDIGYMKRMCRGTRAAKNVRAKTGLINRVRAHSGYVTTRSGRILCFSMIANDYQGSYRAIDKIHEKIMIQLADLP